MPEDRKASAEEGGRRGGTSFPNPPDTETKTARPTSVGPHDRAHEQEDPSNPGIKPEEGYGAEIARNNEAAAAQPKGAGRAPVLAPKPAGESADESGATADMAEKSGPARDAPPLTGIATE